MRISDWSSDVCSSDLDQMICRIQFRKASYKGFYTPPESDRRSIEYPGYNGGTDWGGIAVDPRRGVIVANYNDMPNYVRLVPRAEARKKGWAPRDQARGEIGGAEGAGDTQAHTPYAIDEIGRGAGRGRVGRDV